MFHDMRCCVYVQSAPGDELGCQVYVAGGTLVRREEKRPSYVVRIVCCDCMTWIVYVYVLLCHGVFGGRLRYSRYAVRPYIGGMYHQFVIM